MNWDNMHGKWDELKGEVKSKWAKLTDDDLALVGGKFEELSGRLQQRYGYARDKAEQEIDAFIKAIKPSASSKNKSKSKPDRASH